ncbi:hypothetical protein C5167_010747 [Papaver somniferum]|uniref:Uncharacterized protein n=1 Tax=Papaver somniferum TaxID=3469 RepID=A0A4Y7K2C2_PAPSO|nr:hypothetical protein C5167_010747 [Papaver somniferum]
MNQRLNLDNFIIENKMRSFVVVDERGIEEAIEAGSSQISKLVIETWFSCWRSKVAIDELQLLWAALKVASARLD